MIIWVAIADEQSAVREVLRVMLDGEPDIEVVGQVADGAEVVLQALWQRPDVVVMDLRMPPVDGLSAIRQLADARAPHRGYGLVDPQVVWTSADAAKAPAVIRVALFAWSHRSRGRAGACPGRQLPGEQILVHVPAHTGLS